MQTVEARSGKNRIEAILFTSEDMMDPKFSKVKSEFFVANECQSVFVRKMADAEDRSNRIQTNARQNMAEQMQAERFERLKKKSVVEEPYDPVSLFGLNERKRQVSGNHSLRNKVMAVGFTGLTLASAFGVVIAHK